MQGQTGAGTGGAQGQVSLPVTCQAPRRSPTAGTIRAFAFIRPNTQPYNPPPRFSFPSPPSGPKEAAGLLAGCTSDLKALRKLQRGGGDGSQLSPTECAARTKQLLAAIGHTVDAAVVAAAAQRPGGGGGGGDEFGLQLWDQVSKVTDCAMSGQRLQAVYARIKAVAAAAAAAGGAAAATAAEGGAAAGRGGSGGGP